MATFVISKRLNGFYKFELTSRKGKPILIGNDFELRFECESEIENLRNNISDCFFMKFKSTKGKFYFKIVWKKREIAVSRKYTTQLLMQKSIDEILYSLEKAEVLDFSAEVDVFGDNI